MNYENLEEGSYESLEEKQDRQAVNPSSGGVGRDDKDEGKPMPSELRAEETTMFSSGECQDRTRQKSWLPINSEDPRVSWKACLGFREVSRRKGKLHCSELRMWADLEVLPRRRCFKQP